MIAALVICKQIQKQTGHKTQNIEKAKYMQTADVVVSLQF